MNEVERNLWQALVDLEKAVRTIKAADPKPDLGALFGRIDSLADRLPRGADPNLLHYLRKKSYEKARLFLEGRDKENAVGQCRSA